MDKTILKRYETQWVKIVYYIDDTHQLTNSIKGTLVLSEDSFLVSGDYSEVSGLIKDIRSCKTWFKEQKTFGDVSK